MLDKYISEGILNLIYFGNSVEDYIVAGISLIAFLIVFKFFQVIILVHLKHLAEKTKTDLDDTLIKIVKTLLPPFCSFLAFVFAIQFLSVNEIAGKVIKIILIIWVVYLVVHAVGILIDYLVRKKMGEEQEAGAKSAINLLSLVSKIVLWSFGLLFMLSNLGIDVTSLIAGLGIGGIAIAFALQNVLSDLFSSFAIFFDKPFIPGDFIVVGDKSGTVERIGIKTTRIKALQGEELVISNNELTSAKIQNFKKLRERRVSLSLGVTYDTPTEKIEKVPNAIEKIVEKIDGVRFDRAHFNSFGDSALLIEVVYYALTNDYAEYMDVNQKIHLAIKQYFEEEKIDFAFPSQTIYLEK